jgi:hypothetical protein
MIPHVARLYSRIQFTGQDFHHFIMLPASIAITSSGYLLRRVTEQGTRQQRQWQSQFNIWHLLQLEEPPNIPHFWSLLYFEQGKNYNELQSTVLLNSVRMCDGVPLRK